MIWVSIVTAPVPRQDLLSGLEREQLARSGYDGPRRDEWIAGRLAARRSLEQRIGPRAAAASVLSDDAGVPHVSGAGTPVSISLSHDGGRVAVALAPGRGRVAIDVCDLVHAGRLPGILSRLRVAQLGFDGGLHPCAAWAVLECALKLRRVGITALLNARLELAATVGNRVRVSGLGADAACEAALRPRYALAWAEEAA